MGINIAICEDEAGNAGCREYRRRIVRAKAGSVEGLEHLLESDLALSKEKAMAAVDDWEDLAERNSLDPDEGLVYIGSLKKEDRKRLEGLAEPHCTGWASLESLSPEDREKVLAVATETMTGWDMLSFDEMKAACGSCPLSWDSGRGCIGAFGPENSLLPSIAEKHGCPIVASVPESARSGRVFPPEDAEKLLEECERLKEALPGEGKMAVRRYSGPVERMSAAAKACLSGGCGFRFLRSLVPVQTHQRGDHVGHQGLHSLHPGPVLQVLGGVQRANYRERIGAGHEHAVVEHEPDHLVVDEGASLVRIHRDRPAYLPAEAQVALLQDQRRPLQERLHHAGACPGIRGCRQHDAVRRAHPVQEAVETVVLVHASPVSADLARKAHVAIGELILVQVDYLELDALPLEVVLHVVEDVAGVADRTGAAVEREYLHGARIQVPAKNNAHATGRRKRPADAGYKYVLSITEVGIK